MTTVPAAMDEINASMNALAQELTVFAHNVQAMQTADQHLRQWNLGFGRMAKTLEVLGRGREIQKARLGPMDEKEALDRPPLAPVSGNTNSDSIVGTKGLKAVGQGGDNSKRRTKISTGRVNAGPSAQDTKRMKLTDRWNKALKQSGAELPKKVQL
mmetsp:Transcript_17346/g.31833  ORF Transcript_17346/g.31833 Transcript_17346/m.31833 type:complete len:156 (+) Transcript_17346:140-607(+)